MKQITIVIPTVAPDRTLYCRDTLRALVKQGFGHIIVERTAKDVPRGRRGQGITVQRGIRRALLSSPDAVLVIEDDVSISKRMTPDLLQWVADHEAVTTLYLASGHAFGAAYGDKDDGTVVRPVVGQHIWFGSQAVLLPSKVATDLAALPEETINAFDWEVREYLCVRHMTLFAVVPNLIQHRAPPSIDRKEDAYGRHRSATFR